MHHRIHYLILPVQRNRHSCADCKAPHEQAMAPSSPEDIVLLAHGIASQPQQPFDLKYESVLRTLQQDSSSSFASSLSLLMTIVYTIRTNFTTRIRISFRALWGSLVNRHFYP